MESYILLSLYNIFYMIIFVLCYRFISIKSPLFFLKKDLTYSIPISCGLAFFFQKKYLIPIYK